MAAKNQPSLDVIIERLGQNTQLTKDIGKQVTEGFKALNGRITKDERRLDKLEWEHQNERAELERAREEAKEVIANAAEKAADNPNIGSYRWMLATLAAIIMALITAWATHK